MLSCTDITIRVLTNVYTTSVSHTPIRGMDHFYHPRKFPGAPSQEVHRLPTLHPPRHDYFNFCHCVLDLRPRILKHTDFLEVWMMRDVRK